MDKGTQEGGGEPTRDDAVRRSTITLYNVRSVHLGRRRVEAPMMVVHGDLTGSERSHISVPYHDGPLDASESMYFHGTFALHERWHSRYCNFATIAALMFGLGVLGVASTIMCTIPYFYCVRKNFLDSRNA